MIDYPGEAERALARSLVEELPKSVRKLLLYDDVDLTPAAEHVLYTALRQPAIPAAPTAVGALLRGAVRPVAALPRPNRSKPAGSPGGVLVLVTQPVHGRLFDSIGQALEAMGEPRALRVAARTGETTHVSLTDLTDVDLRGSLTVGAVPGLVRLATAATAQLRHPPSPWAGRADPRAAHRLSALLRVAIPRLAIDAARLSGLFRSMRPRVVACFSESGMLARLAPAAAKPFEIPVLDLPHAEAADPWGSSGIGYDGVAVFGPRAADVMRLAGVPAERIVEIGPLGHDDLHRVDGPRVRPNQVLFASQPTDPRRPHLAEAVKRTALESALAVAAGAQPAEVRVLPHPTEDERDLRRIVDSLLPSAGVPVRIEPAGTLHDRLPGAFVLVTASSQSVFEAVDAGVPAIAVQPPGVPVPVTFVEEGIAIGAASPDEARRVAEALLVESEREVVLERAHTALVRRIGPLDGKAAERAARWLHLAGR